MEPNKSDQHIHKRQRVYRIEHVIDAIQQSDDSEEDGWADDMEPISYSENEESDEHMAEKYQSKSSDDEPMRINILINQMHITLRREGNSYLLLILNLYL